MLVHAFDPGTWEAEACRSLEYQTNLVYTRACFCVFFCCFFVNKGTPIPHTTNNSSAGKFSNLGDMCRLLEKTNSPSMHKMKQKKECSDTEGKIKLKTIPTNAVTGPN